MRKTWQIRGPYGEYLIIRNQDLKSNEKAFVQGGSFISTNLDELLAESTSRDVLLELYKVKNDYLLPEIGIMDSSDIGRFIKPQLDEIFQKKDFQALPISRLYISGYREVVQETKKAKKETTEEKEQQEKPATTVVETPPIEVSNAQWDKDVARRGELLKLTADVKNADDGTPGKMEIWEHDADGNHDFIKTLSTKVQENKLEAEWEFEYTEDTDDIPTAEESEKGYNPPEYFFIAKVGDASAESGLVEFKDWIEIFLCDQDGNPYGNLEVILKYPDGEKKKYKTSDDGKLRLVDILPGKYTFESEGYSFILEKEL